MEPSGTAARNAGSDGLGVRSRGPPVIGREPPAPVPGREAAPDPDPPVLCDSPSVVRVAWVPAVPGLVTAAEACDELYPRCSEAESWSAETTLFRLRERRGSCKKPREGPTFQWGASARVQMCARAGEYSA